MRPPALVAALLSAVVFGHASPPLEDIYAVAPVLRRQSPGTALYQCHYDCGFAIAGGRVAGHCTAQAWLDLYQACLECANTFDIWGDYGNPVTAVAQGCGLTPSPSSSSANAPTALPTLPTYAGVAGGSSADTAASTTTVATASGLASTSTPVTTGTSTKSATPETTAAPGPSTFTSVDNALSTTVETSPDSSITAAPSSSSKNGSSSPSTSSLVTAGAPTTHVSGLAFLVGLGVYFLC